MAKVLVITCDLCLDSSPLEAAEEVVVDGVTLDLCPGHKRRWSELADLQSSGGFRPRPAAASAEPSATPDQDGSPKRRTRVARKAGVKVPARSGRGTTRAAKPDGRGKGGRKAKGKSGASGTSSGAALRKSVDSRAVRAWAQSNGIDVPARGPLKASVIEDFLASPLNAKSKVPPASFTSP